MSLIDLSTLYDSGETSLECEIYNCGLVGCVLLMPDTDCTGHYNEALSSVATVNLLC